MGPNSVLTRIRQMREFVEETSGRKTAQTCCQCSMLCQNTEKRRCELSKCGSRNSAMATSSYWLHKADGLANLQRSDACCAGHVRIKKRGRCEQRRLDLVCEALACMFLPCVSVLVLPSSLFLFVWPRGRLVHGSAYRGVLRWHRTH